MRAFCTSYPYFSRASTASVRLKPIALSCLTASTSSSTAGVTVLGCSSRCGVRKFTGTVGRGSGCGCFFFLPKGRRILSLECLVGASFTFSCASFDDDVEGRGGLGEEVRGGGDLGLAIGEIGLDEAVREGLGGEVGAEVGNTA